MNNEKRVATFLIAHIFETTKSISIISVNLVIIDI